MTKLPAAYYRQHDVLFLSNDLLGKKLVTHIDGAFTSGVITETEAYTGAHDRASHAWGGRRTARTETMYNAGGVAYVYLCYGMHALFNIVTGERGNPQAILIRAVFPLEGIEIIRRRRNHITNNLANGPGKLTQALGINTRMDGIPLTGNVIWLEDYLQVEDKQINRGPRIGVEYAGEDASLAYRFWFDFIPEIKD
ncbi:MAG: DNA-3-methyladenine glycosylase [Bacteroidales bacterium]